ncbi:MAG TPA: 3-deoxy-D-manno-octulosonic acid transferase, partial [Caulobacterales bacterium]|nr:3-deoxy-D-manno-octulosonic acid transferase [Caulobacterales bacterium]
NNVSFSPVLAGYRGAVAALGPFAGLWLDSRVRAGKEDAARLGERFGHYAQTRPDGALIWLHGASVGESGVALQLVDALAARDPSLSFVLSSGTRTSAELIAKRAPKRATHIYAPLDRTDAVRRFLAHWRPDLGVFVESEMWPNLILEAQAAGAPLALVNARMSPSSLARLARWPAAAKRLLDAFSLLLAADRRTADALSMLIDRSVPCVGNIKLAAPAPPVDETKRALLANQIGNRHVWLAASTHAGEDEIVLRAHARLREHFPDALLIIAPRHPERGENIARLADNAPRRSLDQSAEGASVYIADTLGELGLFYSLSSVSFIGGSLLPSLKGHNPVEAAHFDCAILSGPYVESFSDLYGTLFAASAAARVTDDDDISGDIGMMWADEEVLRSAMAQGARRILAGSANALNETASRLMTLAPAAKLEAADAPA